MRVGYVRVSTTEQNTARQEVLIEQLGVERVYIEKISEKSTEGREKLKEMLEFIREGDVVESISRLARNTRAGRFMLTIFGAVAQLEREYILARQKEGIAIAKAEGRYKGRKPIDVDRDKFVTAYNRWKAGEITPRASMAELGVKA